MNASDARWDALELLCQTDSMRRYTSVRARHYARINYWLRTLLALTSVAGAGMALRSDFLHTAGAVLAGFSGFFLGAVLPILKWDDIVSGFQAEQNLWTQFHMDAEDLYRMTGDERNRDAIFTELDRQIRWARLAVARNTVLLPKDERLLAACERESREQYQGLGGHHAPAGPRSESQ